MIRFIINDFALRTQMVNIGAHYRFKPESASIFKHLHGIKHGDVGSGSQMTPLFISLEPPIAGAIRSRVAYIQGLREHGDLSCTTSHFESTSPYTLFQLNTVSQGYRPLCTKLGSVARSCDHEYSRAGA